MNSQDDQYQYHRGSVDQQLKIMNRMLVNIEETLTTMVVWQRFVETRLATGNEKFLQLDKNTASIEDLKSSDRKWGIASMLGAAIAGAIAALRQ
uniref:Uncharacterized protein n=1 Tax=viral metagenome TaxID=1070528 RepID=A0A6M3JBR7_9ZZZZ